MCGQKGEMKWFQQRCLLCFVIERISQFRKTEHRKCPWPLVVKYPEVIGL
jgi:hypothetical protein